MAYLSKFLPKALIILLLFLYVMTFLILVSEECSVTNGVKSVWRRSRQAACWGREKGTKVWGGNTHDQWTRHLSRRTLWRTCVCMCVCVFLGIYVCFLYSCHDANSKKKGRGSWPLCWIKIRPHLGDNRNQPVSVSLIHSLINHDLLHSRDSLKHTHTHTCTTKKRVAL